MKKRSGDDSRCPDYDEMMMQKPLLGTPLDWGNPLNDGTALAFAMNEGHGDKVQDLSMNGNHGTLNNFAFPPTAASGWNPGKTGIGLNFEEAGINYVHCGYNNSLRVNTGSISALFLAHPNQLMFGGRILEIGGADNRIGLHIWDDHKLRFFGKVGAVTNINIASAANLDDSTWHHAVGTWNGSGARLYVDGIEVNSDAGDKTLSLQAGSLCRVGDGSDGLWRGFDGSIDQPRIQSRAWSAKEVKDYAMNPWRVYEQ